MSLVVRPAHSQDVKRYYPDIGATFRAWVAEVDGELAGIVGLVMTRPIACLISVTDDALRPYLRSIPVLRAIKRAEAACVAHGGKVIAVQEENEPTSPAILKRLGFRPYHEVDGQRWHIFGGD